MTHPEIEWTPGEEEAFNALAAGLARIATNQARQERVFNSNVEKDRGVWSFYE